MKVLYIGQYSKGTTSRMRANEIEEILKPEVFSIIDTHIPFYKTSRLWRSFGFRYKKGPLIKNINRFILNNISNYQYDLVWVDKGVFIIPKTLKIIKKITGKLVHFTPDMAFFENQSWLFNSSLYLYDKVITTKSPEKFEYLKRVPRTKLIITTQGFSMQYHKPTVEFFNKENSVAFIGLAEPFRFSIIETLLNAGIKVNIAGFGWTKFVEKHSNNPLFTFFGEKLMNQDYAQFISNSSIAWGALSKRFSELHTTRTFEIPACGTALLTEYNEEIASFYKDDEVIFYKSTEELIQKVQYFLSHDKELAHIAKKGNKRVHTNGYNYDAILRNILTKVVK